MIKKENLNQWKTTLLGEALLFGLLGKAIYEELDKPWLEELIAEDMFTEVPFGAGQEEIKHGLDLLQIWAKENRKSISEEKFRALNQDKLYLFIGTDHVQAPVWESVYLSEDRLTFQEQTLDVRNWYRRFGLEADKIYREPDDHIGLEMIFLAHLATLGIQALDQQEPTHFDELLDAQRDFLRNTWAHGL